MVELHSLGISRGVGLFLPIQRTLVPRLLGWRNSSGLSSRPSVSDRFAHPDDEEELDLLWQTRFQPSVAKYWTVRSAFVWWLTVTFTLVRVDQSHLRQGTTLRQHLEVWDQLFPETWATRRVRFGFHLEIDPGLPPQTRVPREVHEGEGKVALRQLMKEEEAKGVVRRLDGQPTVGPGVYFLLIFPVPKKEAGKFRICVNAKPLNPWILNRHFKGEGLKEFLAVLLPGDFAITTDWSGFFNHAVLDAPSARMSRTTLDGEMWEYSCLTFGFTSAPRDLHMLIRPGCGLLGLLGIRRGGQTDDWAYLGENYLDCLVRAQVAVSLWSMLGFIHNDKGSSVPSQRIDHLGGVFDTRLSVACLPRAKVFKIRRECRWLLDQSQRGQAVEIRRLAALLGQLMAARYFVVVHRLRSLELMRLVIESSEEVGWDGKVELAPPVVSCIMWWMVNLHAVNGRSWRVVTPDLTITKDASGSGWGAVLMETGEVIHGFWDRLVFGGHSTHVELLADIAASKAFILAKDLRDITITIRSDNMSSVSYINRQGGRVPGLAREITPFLLWAWEERRISFVSVHVAGVDNVADAPSRIQNAWTELEMSWWAFQQLEEEWGTMELDCMASSVNTKCQEFISWHPDPCTSRVDFFTFSLTSLPRVLYMFPPDPMIVRVLMKIREEGESSRIVLVTPLWTSQPWFPLLLSLMIDLPLFFLDQSTIVLPPILELAGKECPTGPWIVSCLSGNRCWREEFQTRLSGDRLCHTKAEMFMESIMISRLRGGKPSARERELILNVLARLF